MSATDFLTVAQSVILASKEGRLLFTNGADHYFMARDGVVVHAHGVNYTITRMDADASASYLKASGCREHRDLRLEHALEDIAWQNYGVMLRRDRRGVVCWITACYADAPGFETIQGRLY